MDTTFPVIVVDDKGANVSGARVSLVEKDELDASGDPNLVAVHPYPGLDATHDDAGGGSYKEKSPIPKDAGKDWALVVTLAGKAPVVQPLKFKKGGAGGFTVAPQPAAVATVTITGKFLKVGASTVKEITFHVTLFPAAELVFIGGVDFKYHPDDISQGNQFHEYGSTRAKILRLEKKIHDGTIVTVFSTSQIFRKKQVFGFPLRDGTPTLVDIEVARLWGDPKSRVIPKKPGHYKPQLHVDIHITDFYGYLAEVGGRAPKSIQEIGIFSHSFPNGPILYNTNDHNGALDPDRDPNDFDARAKDFNNKNFPAFNGMLAAFAPGCRFTIWGCSFTVHYKDSTLAALAAIKKGLAEDAFFSVPVRTEVKEHGHTSIEEQNLSELRHRILMEREFRSKFVYASAAAQALQIEVRAACPGTGSDVLKVKGFEVFQVNLAAYGGVYEYFRKQFAPEFAETKSTWDQGFVDYHAVQKHKRTKEPPFSTEYYDFNVSIPAGPVGGTLGFWNGKFTPHLSSDVKIEVKPVADLVTQGKKGHLFLLKQSTLTMGFYAQDDGRVFGIDQDATHAWTVVGAEVL